MKELGIKFKYQDNVLLASNLEDGSLDCDTSSFVVLAVGYELGWPVGSVRLPHHVFVRWVNKKERFNVDQGYIRSDQYYRDRWNLSDLVIAGGVYFDTDNREELMAQFFTNRGLTKGALGYHAEARLDFKKANELNPAFPPP